jgi:hypothetical protein
MVDQNYLTFLVDIENPLCKIMVKVIDLKKDKGQKQERTSMKEK